tara:strand:- start:4882 stop:5838 length:957 start_codon:yes stop_codon:yes gene_type:complete
MSLDFLDFEQPIEELHAKIRELKHIVQTQDDEQLSSEISALQQQSEALTRKIFSNLSSWQVAQIARHPQRPHTKDYIERILTDFDELHGDRAYADDESVIAGTARLNDIPVMVIGHQKGRTTQEKVKRNFGMPSPEGYRKAKRLIMLAERFNMPIITFIDTPGAYPGVGAEERGQSEAIAANLKLLSGIKVPVICNVIGEGGSGGALAIGVGDQLNMLEFSTYSVISPEGCASILWKSAEKASLAAESMRITAERLHELELIDSIIKEPLGGAHRDFDFMAQQLKKAIVQDLENLRGMPHQALVERRYKRLSRYSYNL